MKKILFPFETNNAIYKEAYIYAVKAARNLHAELIMLNVFSIDSQNEITKDAYSKKLRYNWLLAYNEVVNLNQYYIENHAKPGIEFNIRYDYRFIHGKQADEIHNILEKDTIDLLVVPFSDDANLNKKQLRLIRDDIFERNEASLLIIPKNKKFNPLSNIVFATDLKKLKHHDLYLNDMLRYASAFDSNIHFLHINTGGNPVLPKDIEAYRTMMQIIETNKKKAHVFKSINSMKISESIMQYAHEVNAEMIVVVKHQHSFLDAFFHSSLSESLSINSDIPLLVMREKSK